MEPQELKRSMKWLLEPSAQRSRLSFWSVPGRKVFDSEHCVSAMNARMRSGNL